VILAKNIDGDDRPVVVFAVAIVTITSEMRQAGRA